MNSGPLKGKNDMIDENLFANTIAHGEELFLRGEIQEAFEAFESVLEKDPDNVRALNDKGVLLNSTERPQEAILNFSKALEIDPYHPDAAFNLISTHLALADWEGAETHYSRYAGSLPPRNAETLAPDILELKFGDTCSPSLKSIPLTVHIDSHTYFLRLFLDTRKYSQRILWDHVSRNQAYEPGLFKLLGEVFEPGDCFVDVGAHIGYFSLLASRIVGEKGRVIAVEPEALNAAHLEKHLRENKADNVILIQGAAGAVTGEANLYYNSDNDGGHALWDTGLHFYNQKTREQRIVRRVPSFTVDDILGQSGTGKIKLLKIDTEGAEKDVLSGCTKIISNDGVPYVVCEINAFGLHQMGTHEKEIRDFMEEQGFGTYLLQDGSPHIVRLLPGQYVKSRYVFNLLFMKGNLQGDNFSGVD